MRSRSLGCDGKQSLGKKIFFRFATETRKTSASDCNGGYTVKQRRSSSSLQRNYLSSDNGFTVLQCFFSMRDHYVFYKPELL